MLNKNEYVTEIEENKNTLLKLIESINSKTPIDKVKKITNAMCLSGTGIYSSHKIEQYFLDISKTIKVETSESYNPNSVLHVLTESYEYGGHTRVVERWIANAPENETHSIYLTNQKEKDIPASLKDIVISQHGNIHCFYDEDCINAACKLRQTASKYEKVILHVHMDDFIPLLAFGTSEFKRPVLLYNHADHLGWLGISIADLVLEIRSFGTEITKNKRGCSRQYKIGIPVYRPEKQQYKTRKELGLPENKKIIFSCGNEQKYKSIDNINIFNIIKELTDKYDIVFVLVGIKNIKSFKLKKYRINKEKMIILPSMEHKRLMSYINAADIVIDSFPMSGATALMDAVALEKPVVSGCSMVGQMDYIVKTPYYCNTINELVEKLKSLIENEHEKANNISIVTKSLHENDSIECFKRNINNLNSIIPQEHSIYKFNELQDNNIIENDIYRLRSSSKKKVKINTGIIKVIKCKNKFKKWIEIIIANKITIKFMIKRYIKI